jgi:hypothetical protein
MSLLKLQRSLQKLAESLVNEENQLIKDAEEISTSALEITASALVQASNILAQAAAQVEHNAYAGLNIYNVLDQDSLNEIATIAAEFDRSGDPELEKQASVLDQILMTLAAPQDAIENSKKAFDAEIDRIKKNKANAAISKNSVDAKAVSKAFKEQIKDYRPLEAPLNTRTCPDHPGAQIIRIDDQTYQCSLDKKIYNYKDGFTTMKGNKIPGSDVARQTDLMNDTINTSITFSTRDEKMGR